MPSARDRGRARRPAATCSAPRCSTRASARLRIEARADSSAPAVFLPYVTNATGQPLTLRINVGSTAEESCRCSVPPGAVRVPLGYFPLYRNSSVRAILPNGRVATFEGLGSQVNRASGVVRLRFDEKDFRDTTALQRKNLEVRLTLTPLQAEDSRRSHGIIAELLPYLVDRPRQLPEPFPLRRLEEVGRRRPRKVRGADADQAHARGSVAAPC